MLKRGFSILGRVGSKAKGHSSEDAKKLQAMLKYIASNRTTLSSFLRPPEQCEKNVVDLLNKELSDVSKQERTVNTHYEILIHSLRKIADRNMHAKSLKERIEECKNDGDALLRLVWELHLYQSDHLAPKDFCRIVINPDFSVAHANSLLRSFESFTAHRVDYSVILCYKAKNRTFYKENMDEWVDNYRSMTSIAQKLFWRTVNFMDGIADVNEYASKIGLVNDRGQVVILHQVLHMNAHRLQEGLLRAPLTHNQLLFCKVLRLLAPVTKYNAEATHWCTDLVKTSIANKISQEVVDADNSYQCSSSAGRNINIFQYNTIQHMHNLLSKVVQQTSDDPQLQSEILLLLQELHKEKNELQTQMVLRFV